MYNSNTELYYFGISGKKRYSSRTTSEKESNQTTPTTKKNNTIYTYK